MNNLWQFVSPKNVFRRTQCVHTTINYANALLMRDFWLHLNIIQINLAAVFGLHKNCKLLIVN